MRKEDLLLFS